MPPFVWTRPQHPRWLIACTTGLLLSLVVGGFSFAVLAIFVVIFGVGAVLLNPSDPVADDDDLWWGETPERADDDTGDVGETDDEAGDAEEFAEATDVSGETPGDEGDGEGDEQQEAVADREDAAGEDAEEGVVDYPEDGDETGQRRSDVSETSTSG